MAEHDKDAEEQDNSTDTYKIAMETTGETAPRSDLDGNLEKRAGEDENSEDFDATSGAGGTTAGGGASGVPT
ncbi:MAG TPA: hypothetical protein VGC97_19350 [Pyrinomonadaceae bacterium]|jgi:hypothetical protein